MKTEGYDVDRICLFDGIFYGGFFSAGTAVFQMIALSQTLAVYVMAIKRVSIFLSILLGGLIFKEKNLRSKLLGGAIMVLEVIFITIL